MWIDIHIPLLKELETMFTNSGSINISLLRSEESHPCSKVRGTGIPPVNHAQDARATKSLRVLDCTNQFRQRVLRVTVQHAGHRFEEQRIFETGKTLALPAFEDDD